MSDNGRSVLGFVVRGVELFTGTSTVLPGARAYENKAEFHRCMHILNDLGFVNLSPRSPTTVAPKYKDLNGLLIGVLEYYGLTEADAEKPSLAHGYEHFRRGNRKGRRGSSAAKDGGSATSSRAYTYGGDDASVSSSRRSTRQSAQYSDSSERSERARTLRSDVAAVAQLSTPKRYRPATLDEERAARKSLKRARLLKRLLADPVRMPTPPSDEENSGEEEGAFNLMMAGGLPIDPDHLDEFVEAQQTFKDGEHVMVWQNERLYPAHIEAVRDVHCHFPPMDIRWFRVHFTHWHPRFDQWVTADKLVKRDLALAGHEDAGRSAEERASKSTADPDDSLTPAQRRVANGEKITPDMIVCILAKLYVGDSVKYYVQWRDAANASTVPPCSWEWSANLDCAEMVRRFEEERHHSMVQQSAAAIADADDASASLSASASLARVRRTSNLPSMPVTPVQATRKRVFQSKCPHKRLKTQHGGADSTISCDGDMSSTNAAGDPHTDVRVAEHDLSAAFVVSPWTTV